MASNKKSDASGTLPFGAGALDDSGGDRSSVAAKRKTRASRVARTSEKGSTDKGAGADAEDGEGAKKRSAKKATKKAVKKVAKKATKKAVKSATKKTARKAAKATKSAKTSKATKTTRTAKATKKATKKTAAKKAATKKKASKKKATGKSRAEAQAEATQPELQDIESPEVATQEPRGFASIDFFQEASPEEAAASRDEEQPARAAASDAWARRDVAPDKQSDASPEAEARHQGDDSEALPADNPYAGAMSRRAEKRRRWKERRSRRRGKGRGDDEPEQGSGDAGAPVDEVAEEVSKEPEPSPWAVAKRRKEGGLTRRDSAPVRWEKRPAPGGTAVKADAPAGRSSREVEGILVLEKMNHGHLRLAENHYFATKQDPHIAPQMVQRLGLREGALLRGRVRRGQGRHKWELSDIIEVDGEDPRSVRTQPTFKNLTSIDPDFHYAVGDGSGEVSLKVVDILCPVGRGQRGLIVAPPRSGKTVLLQQFAHAIEDIYPEVHLMVLLLDERPEEATEWKRALKKGEVFVSTNDEPPKRHVELAEVVAARCKRLVEMGEDVILLLDSITRMGRAYNNVFGNSGKTMSGGIDSRALERPKQFFGAARNTETAGSLTILGTTLVDTGSRMDQVIFEEFKGTGNMELVLARRLADRRIFPAIDVERSGTRKEEKLLSSTRHRRCSTLRRVLMRMHWAEAMELLITKLEAVEKIDDFLQRFDIDPEA